MKIILYSFRRCPYAMRARMALSYAGIGYQHREILLKDKPKSLLRYSHKGTVPVLVVGDTVIDESLEIMFWALEQNDKDNWRLPKEQIELIQLCDQQFKAQLDCYKYSARYDLTELEYRMQALWFLDLLAEKLRKNKHLYSDQMCMADSAIFPFIRQFAFVNKKWFDQTVQQNLLDWFNFHLNSKLFQTIMIKQPIWQE